ncbi:glycosyltransferase [Vibrio sp. K4]|uniref:glycosyltransferase n=1 Tax=Vibrio sp. K4 TaxID=3391579 RepID=UPI003DA76B40
MKKHILINSLSGGGAERVVSSIVNSQPEKFTLVSIWNINEYDLNSEVQYTALLNKKRFLLLDLILAFFKLLFFVKAENVKYINSHLFWANYLNVVVSFFTKHKTYCTHCVAFESKFKKGTFSYFFHYLLCCKLLTRAYGHTFKCNDLMVSYRKIFKFRHCSVIYNPVVKKIDDDSNRIQFPFIENCKYILCVGRFHETKNQKEIIKALKLLPENIHVIFLGDGPKLEECKNLSIRLNVSNRVHFLGHCNNPSYFYQRVSYLISGSLSEGFPNVMIEAIFHKCFPITYDCETGPREVSSVLYTAPHVSYDKYDVYPLGVVFKSSDYLTISEAISFTLEANLEVNEVSSKFVLDALNLGKITNSYFSLY